VVVDGAVEVRATVVAYVDRSTLIIFVHRNHRFLDQLRWRSTEMLIGRVIAS